MNNKLNEIIEITDLKDMLNKTKKIYGNRPAYKIRNGEGGYKIITHNEIREMIDCLGTAICNLGLRGKRIAVIGENRYEWGLSYLSIVCGTGIVVPLDKLLPENELESLIERSKIEAIFYTSKYEETVKKIRKNKNNNLKYLISMDLKESTDDIYSQQELVEEGRELIQKGYRDFIDAKINPEEMSIMLFTSGTTSKSKAVALSHKNICSNLIGIGKSIDINCEDILLSNLPLHHVFECTVGLLFTLYRGAQTVYCDSLIHIVDNLREYKASVMFSVPGIYEKIFVMIKKKLEKENKLQEIIDNKEKYEKMSMEERKETFKDIHKILGENIKILFSGAAALDSKVEEGYQLLGFDIAQGYGLTETSPVISVGTRKFHKIGSVGKAIPGVEAKVVDVNNEGIGELIVKGDNIMLGYYENDKETKEVLKNGWFYTGDLAKIDDDGYIYICGRKKNVIVLKNGKNIFPEEMENLINKIDGVEESFIFGKESLKDRENIKINVQIVFNRNTMKELYNVESDEEIYLIFSQKIKEVNKTMPSYKSIRGILITEKPLIKTTTNKIKRQANLDEIEKIKD